MKTLVFFFCLLCVPVFSQRQCIRFIYVNQIGVEESGNNRGTSVSSYLNTAGVKPGNPWCASFVYWCYKLCDPSIKIKNPAQAASWFPENRIIWKRNKILKCHPQFADVIGIYHNGRINHVGFYDSETRDFIITVEGNVSGGSDNNEGVWRLKRMKRTVYAISKWVSY